MRHIRKRSFRLHGCAALCALAAAGCTNPTDPSVDEVEAKTKIYNGPVASDFLQQGTPQIVVANANGGTACTAVVYSQYWLITAAHCFDPSFDTNNDGVISGSERPSTFFAHFLVVDANGTSGQIAIEAAYRHPSTTWGDTATWSVDAALVRLDSSSSGVYTPYLYPVNYTNGKLKIYQGSTASLLNQYLLAFGWGTTNENPYTADGQLHKAWKTVSNVTMSPPLQGDYNAVPYNNAGTSCRGDSGGPDYLWDGSGFQMVGIHSTGGCQDGWEGDIGAERWRSWVVATAQ
jgi:uncharacterized protein YqkB